MTDPDVRLDVDRVAVEPGGQASVTISITNPGSIVEGYRIEVLGEGAADWGEALPPEVSVYPQQDTQVIVVFRPPGGTGAPGGSWPFGIRVRSTEDSDASVVVEGDLDIGKVFGLQAKLLPVNSSGRWRGVHVIQLSNWGNAAVTLKLSAANQDDALGFMIRPEAVAVPLGGTATARLWAKTKSPSLRGTQTRIPFTVTAEQEGAPAQPGPVPQYGGTPERPSVDGAFTQKPILGRGTVMIAALALLLLVAGVAWTLTRPPPAAATFAELGTPATPSDVTATAAGPSSIQVRWTSVPNVEKYTVAQVVAGAQTKSVDVPATDSLYTLGDLAPSQTVCLAVTAWRGKSSSPPSDPACATTPALPGTPSTSPGAASTTGPSTTDPGTSPSASASGDATTSPPDDGATSSPASIKGKWFAAGWWTMENSVYVSEEKLAELREGDPDANLTKSTDHPTMLPRLPAPSWVLYRGPYDTAAQAVAACDLVREVLDPTNCKPVRLEP